MYISLLFHILYLFPTRGRRVPDRMIVGFTTIYTISALDKTLCDKTLCDTV
jgi:hypothetical protein